DIQNYFIESAFPNIDVFQDILRALEGREAMSLYEILAEINTSPSMAEKALRLLEVDGAVGRTFSGKARYFRTPNRWNPDVERINRVIGLRKSELAQMQTYVDHRGCLMQFLLEALDDPTPVPCGRCANCQGKGFSTAVPWELEAEAENYLKNIHIPIIPLRRWPAGLFSPQKQLIPRELRNAPGRSLCYYGDAGWGAWVRSGKYVDGRFRDELIDAAVHLINVDWQPDPRPTWVCAIPSRRHPTLVPRLASDIARKLGIPFIPALRRVRDTAEQKLMQNKVMQSRNVLDSLGIEGSIPDGPVLLIDDIVDSRWTLTVAGYLLRENGSGVVYPFTLARATGGS
ncbi:MAG: ATP-dependent DNA helicase RecG, partial [Anaerolineae bacterium]|nr:ATP-dependent DNA helicase RecG [Anaerolineae bacterium]